MVDVLYHFSEDPSIERFIPHVPRTNPAQQPAVWAIDAAHAPLYWFPRDCPRVTAWPRDESERVSFGEAFCTAAARVHAMELEWLHAMRNTALYRYSLTASAFRPWPEATGQWICEWSVEPVDVHPVGDLLQLHVDAAIELRLVPNLWPIRDLAISDRWDFSIVRMSNAKPRIKLQRLHS